MRLTGLAYGMPPLNPQHLGTLTIYGLAFLRDKLPRLKSVVSSWHPLDLRKKSYISQPPLPPAFFSCFLCYTEPAIEMAPIPPLFTLPIEPSGTMTCTQPSPQVYLLTFESPPDNRLTASFCGCFTLALDILVHRYPKGVVVTTSAVAKFYSNGLDFESAMKTKDFFGNILYPFWRRLLT